MAPKPLTDEAIALTEKKMDMALDDIIKMSKTNTMKPKKQRNRAQKFAPNAVRERYTKARSFMDTRSSLRQGSLARRRSNFQGNQFSSSAEVARKAATAPIRNRGFNHSRTFNVNKPRAGLSAAQKVVTYGGGFTVMKPQTLDSRFASMKEQRMQVVSQQSNGARRNGGVHQPRSTWTRNRRN